MNNQQLEREYYKANSLANWSFVGMLLMPVAGVILALLSMSKLRWLMDINENEDTAYTLDSTYTKAALGMGLSIFFMIVGIIVSVLLYSLIIVSTEDALNDALNTKCTYKTTGDIYNMESTTHCE